MLMRRRRSFCPAGNRLFGPLAVDLPHDTEWIVVAKSRWQQILRRVLIGDRTHEPADRSRADGRCARIRRCRIRPTVHDRAADFDTGWITVHDHAADGSFQLSQNGRRKLAILIAANMQSASKVSAEGRDTRECL